MLHSLVRARFVKAAFLALLVATLCGVKGLAQPTSISMSPGTTVPGEGFTVSVGNGANMTIDVTYVYSFGHLVDPPVEVIAWQTLNSAGEKYVALPLDTIDGKYTITHIRETGTTVWVDVADAAVVVEIQPTYVMVGDAAYLSECYTVAVDAPDTVVDLKYRFNSGPQTILQLWINYFGYGCTYASAIGNYTYEEVKNSVAINWVNSVDDTIQIIPSPSPDFFLTISPNEAHVAQLQSVDYSVTLAPLWGFSSTVSLSVTGLPSGASVSFNPTQTLGSSQQQTTLTISSGLAQPGSYPFTVIGTAGPLQRSFGATLIVTPGPQVKEYIYAGGRLIAVEVP